MLEFWVTKKLIESKKSLRTMVRFLTKLVRNLTKLVRNLGIYPEVRIALTVIVLGHVLALFNPIQQNNHWKRIKELEFNIDLKQKLLNSMSKPQTILNLTLIVIGPFIAQYNPIQFKQPFYLK